MSLILDQFFEKSLDKKKIRIAGFHSRFYLVGK